MTLYFIRHGQSQANADGVLAGQLDSPLTELGRHQAEHEGERLRSNGQAFDVIISSPLVRAYDTAVAIAAALDYPLDRLNVDSRLMERHVGILEDKPVALLGAAILNQTMGIELNEVLATRCRAVLDDCKRLYEDRTVLLVAHAGVGEMMKRLVSGAVSGDQQPELSMPNAQVFRLT